MQTVPSSQGWLLLSTAQPVFGSQLSVVQAFPSSHTLPTPAKQLPPWHASFNVHELLSVQNAVLLTNTQPCAGSQASSVHKLPSVQIKALPGWHAPALQTSLVVHHDPSSQGMALGKALQPIFGSQLSVVQGLLSSQSTAAPGEQLPPSQVSPTEHALLSSQTAPFRGYAQPLSLTQVSSVQGFPSLHTVALPGTHALSLHTSPVVHALLSSHVSEFTTFLQPCAGSQVSVVQGFLSSHAGGMPGTQLPDLHTSLLVQALLSSQAAVFATKPQPPTLAQVSSVQGFPSLQTKGLPKPQLPSLQTSPAVQASPSSHKIAFFTLTHPALGSQLSVVQGF